MSDTPTLTVREACEHGYYDGHPVLHGLDCGPDCEYEHRTDDVCPGGREIVLRRVYVNSSRFNVEWASEPQGDRQREVWVEV